MFALDEVIVAGQKEKVTLSQIKTLTEMDSHEERIHEIVERVRKMIFGQFFKFLLHVINFL
jgi:hypothetical protein